ncbi:MAG: AbrB/MazE/SpoVT family DNA-binding domain-containing protein [Hyphomicrobiales bacterium]|nr:AbrB/MazE/SpoVT family DNA-binding domain-containing protein [Hyphomicrobiales bacterium]
MQVSKWGDSLAVRLPAAVVEALGLKEGDDIEIVVAGGRRFEVARDDKRTAALAKTREMRLPMPPDYKFDRDEANER